MLGQRSLKSEELKRKEILNILEEMLGKEMAARSQIFVID